MAKYVVQMEEGVTSTTAATDSWGTIHNAAAARRRMKLFYTQLGITGADASNNYAIAVQRLTAVGTQTAVTPASMDLADLAAVNLAGENNTGAHTYTANEEMLNFEFNQRATVQWTARPGCEIVTAAVASASAGYGLGWRTIVQSGGLAAIAVAHFEEQ